MDAPVDATAVSTFFSVVIGLVLIVTGFMLIADDDGDIQW